MIEKEEGRSQEKGRSQEEGRRRSQGGEESKRVGRRGGIKINIDK